MRKLKEAQAAIITRVTNVILGFFFSDARRDRDGGGGHRDMRGGQRLLTKKEMVLEKVM